jgi:hypothetical protein
MKPTVYIETTIPSYLVARPSKLPRLQADQATTRQWWDQHAGEFEMFVSDIVIREVRRGDAAMAEDRLAKIQGLPVLTLSEAAEDLAALLLEKVIPPQAIDDAAHIAVSAVSGLDFLLTWNCRHINNRYTIRRIEKCCADAGFACPVIATPSELMSIES